MWIQRDERISYDGLNLKEDLQHGYERAADLCTVVYRNSASRPVTLHFTEVLQRMFRMSYDPYDCIERRWGASAADELATCANTPTENRWYEAQQRLRNQIDRTYDTRMDFTVKELEGRGPGTGADQQPDIDVKRVIDNTGYRVPYKPMQPPGY
jgi:hypothetical protein